MQSPLGIVLIYALYLALFGYPLYMLGQAFSVQHRYLAWFPILGLTVLTSAAKMTPLYVLALLVAPVLFPREGTLVFFVISSYLWARICRRIELNELHGWATAVPLVNFILIWFIASETLKRDSVQNL